MSEKRTLQIITETLLEFVNRRGNRLRGGIADVD